MIVNADSAQIYRDLPILSAAPTTDEQGTADHRLYGTEDAVNFVVRQGAVNRVDGPYAEAKEVVGGWAIMQYDTVEEAVADQEGFAQLHAKYWPEVTVISTLRQISTGPEAPGE